MTTAWVLSIKSGEPGFSFYFFLPRNLLMNTEPSLPWWPALHSRDLSHEASYFSNLWAVGACSSCICITKSPLRWLHVENKFGLFWVEHRTQCKYDTAIDHRESGGDSPDWRGGMATCTAYAGEACEIFRGLQLWQRCWGESKKLSVDTGRETWCDCEIALGDPEQFALLSELLAVVGSMHHEGGCYAGDSGII